MRPLRQSHHEVNQEIDSWFVVRGKLYLSPGRKWSVDWNASESEIIAIFTDERQARRFADLINEEAFEEMPRAADGGASISNVDARAHVTPFEDL